MLIDYQLAGSQKDGLQLVEEYQKRFPHIPSILITAYPTEDLIEECKNKKIPLIQKPFDDRFPEMVEECLVCFGEGEVPTEPHPPNPWCPQEEPQLVDQLYRDTYHDALRWMISKVRKQDVAEELVQKSFLYIWNNPDIRFSTHQEFFNYLYKTMEDRRNDWVKMQIRGSIALQNMKKLESAIFTSVLFEHLEHNEKIEVVMKAMALLKEREQDVIRLRYLEEKPFQDIAEELGLSLEAAKKISQRAIKKLKKFVPF